MKIFDTDSIRNVALIGHSGEGKTSLAEAMMFEAKTIDRLGKVDDGSSTMDYDDEEIKRKISISLSRDFPLRQQDYDRRRFLARQTGQGRSVRSYKNEKRRNRRGA